MSHVPMNYFSRNISKNFNASIRISRPEVFCKKGVLKSFAKFTENTCARVSFIIKFIKKEALAQVFSFEFCEIFRTPPVAASIVLQNVINR